LKNKTIYKFIDLGGMILFYEKIEHFSIGYAAVEHLISLHVKGYNCDRATLEYDVWTIALVFTFLEGYTLIYLDDLYNPI